MNEINRFIYYYGKVKFYEGIRFMVQDEVMNDNFFCNILYFKN